MSAPKRAARHQLDADLTHSFYGFPAHSLTGATLAGVRASVLKVGEAMTERLDTLRLNPNEEYAEYLGWLEDNVGRYNSAEYDALPRTAVVHRILYDVQGSEAEAVAVILRTHASGVDLVEIDDRRFADLDAQPLGYEYVEVPYDSLRYTTVVAGSRRRMLNASNFFQVIGGAGLDIDGLCHPEIWVAPWLFLERSMLPPPPAGAAADGAETTNRRAVFWERRASERGETMVLGLLLACRRPLQDDNEQLPTAFEHTVCSAVCRSDGVIFVVVPELPPPTAEGHLFLVDTTLHAAVWPCVKQLMDGASGQFPDRVSQLKSPWIRYFHRTDFPTKNQHELSNRIPKMCALLTRTRGTSILPLVVGVEVARAISAFLISHERNLAHKRRAIVMAARREAAVKAGRDPARVRRDIAPLHMNLPSVRVTPDNEPLTMLAQALAACSVCQTITFARSLELCKKSRRELRAEAKAQFAAAPEDARVSPLLRPEDVDSHEEDAGDDDDNGKTETDDSDGRSSDDEQVCVMCPSDAAGANGDRYVRSAGEAWARKNGRRVIFSATQTYGCAECGACFCSIGCMQSSDHVCAVFRALPRKLTQPRVVLEAEQKRSEKNAARQRAKRENRRRRKCGAGGGADGADGEGAVAIEATDARAARARSEAAERYLQTQRADMDRTATEVALKLAEARANRAQNIANCVKAEILQRQQALDAGEAWQDAETKARWAAIVKKINLLPNPTAFEGAIALLNGTTQGRKDCAEALLVAPASVPATHSTVVGRPLARDADGGAAPATAAVAADDDANGGSSGSDGAAAEALDTTAAALDALSCVHPLWQGTRDCGPRRSGDAPLRSDELFFCGESDADDEPGAKSRGANDRALVAGSDERMVAALRRRRLVRESLERECANAAAPLAAPTASSAHTHRRARGRGNAVQRLRQQLPYATPCATPPPPPPPPPAPPAPPAPPPRRPTRAA